MGLKINLVGQLAVPVYNNPTVDIHLYRFAKQS